MCVRHKLVINRKKTMTKKIKQFHGKSKDNCVLCTYIKDSTLNIII